MSFGGSVLGMIISIRNNSMAKIRVSKLLKENQRLISGLKGNLHFKKISEEGIKQIKQEIKRRARLQRNIRILISIPLILVLVAISSLLWISTKKEMHQEELLKVEQQVILNERNYNKYMSELNIGYKSLAKEQYIAAKFYFDNASQLRPNDYRTRVAISTAFMYDCIKNKVKCDTVNTLLMNLDARFNGKREVNDLLEYYNENEELFTVTNTK